MKREALTKAEDAARSVLEALPDTFTYHDTWHTFGVVLPVAERFAAMEGLDQRTALLLRLAAAFHDTGFSVRYRGHESASAEIAEHTLEKLGFDGGALAAVREMILATRIPQKPRTLASRVLADADLDVLGREDFLSYNRHLRQELELHGRTYSDAEWLKSQIAFLEAHTYFTKSAREQREGAKRANLARLRALLCSTEGS